ncbi:hypothetical protein ACQEXU_17665 [Vibrio sp. TRT 21S02]
MHCNQSEDDTVPPLKVNDLKRLAILPVDNQDRQQMIDDPVNKI